VTPVYLPGTELSFAQDQTAKPPMFVKQRIKLVSPTRTNQVTHAKTSLEFNPELVPIPSPIPVAEIVFDLVLENSDDLRKKFWEMQQTFLDFKKEFAASKVNLSPRLFPQGYLSDLSLGEKILEENIDREIIRRLLIPISEKADPVHS
jgi:hypothetical protein